MLNVDEIQNGIVIDHIPAGKSTQLIKLAQLERPDCSVAILKNVRSQKTGRKDIIKVEGNIKDLQWDVIGYLDEHITVTVIENGKIVRKEKPNPPAELVNVIHCKNPRCITGIEQFCDQVFRMTPSGKYRCIYCEQEFEQETF